MTIKWEKLKGYKKILSLNNNMWHIISPLSPTNSTRGHCAIQDRLFTISPLTQYSGHTDAPSLKKKPCILPCDLSKSKLLIIAFYKDCMNYILEVNNTQGHSLFISKPIIDSLPIIN